MTGTDLLHVTSADGTTLALERVTEGARPLITLAGGPTGRRVWAGVSTWLGGRFAVWLADRRGKGDSTDATAAGGWSFEREHEDLRALSAAFGGEAVFAGHSSAAVCLLGAAADGLATPALVLYEPPWPLPGRADTTAVLDEMEAHLDAGDAEAALLTGLRGLVELPPPVIEAYRRAPGWAERVANVRSWPREARELQRMTPGTAALAGVAVPTLLLDGEVSPEHLRASTRAVARVVTGADVVELPGQGHGALVAAPDVVADAINRWSGSALRPGGRAARPGSARGGS